MNKNYIIFTILAVAVALPAAYAATLIIDPVPLDSETDGVNGFSLISGAASVDTFVNGSHNLAAVI
ncbi:MAG: hypothetical protein H8E89_01245, partial [Candidatus Nitrosopelagicus sp.]|nr:hypothetical protein [Candidatus Nitrosopelagicus sp.]